MCGSNGIRGTSQQEGKDNAKAEAESERQETKQKIVSVKRCTSSIVDGGKKA